MLDAFLEQCIKTNTLSLAIVFLPDAWHTCLEQFFHELERAASGHKKAKSCCLKCDVFPANRAALPGRKEFSAKMLGGPLTSLLARLESVSRVLQNKGTKAASAVAESAIISDIAIAVGRLWKPSHENVVGRLWKSSCENVGGRL